MYLDKHIGLINEYSNSHNQKPLFTVIHGSQNYNLNLPNSDVDSRTYFLPCLDDIIKEKKAFPEKIKDGEEGILSLDSVYKFFKQLFYKSAFNTIELLFSVEYHFYNNNFRKFWKENIKPYKKNILYLNPENVITSIFGMIFQNLSLSEKALSKNQPSSFWKKISYVEYFLEILLNYINKDKENIFNSCQTDYLKIVKIGRKDRDERRYFEQIKERVDYIKNFVNLENSDILKENFDIDNFYNNFIVFVKGELV